MVDNLEIYLRCMDKWISKIVLQVSLNKNTNITN